MCIRREEKRREEKRREEKRREEKRREEKRREEKRREENREFFSQFTPAHSAGLAENPASAAYRNKNKSVRSAPAEKCATSSHAEALMTSLETQMAVLEKQIALLREEGQEAGITFPVPELQHVFVVGPETISVFWGMVPGDLVCPWGTSFRRSFQKSANIQEQR